VQINYIFTEKVHILCLSCNVKKFKTTAILSQKIRNKGTSDRFQWCSLQRSHFTLLPPSIYINQVPEKLYFGQWVIIIKLSSKCNLTVQIEPVQDKYIYLFGCLTNLFIKMMINIYFLSYNKIITVFYIFNTYIYIYLKNSYD
jgi:hypothetical protein